MGATQPCLNRLMFPGCMSPPFLWETTTWAFHASYLYSKTSKVLPAWRCAPRYGCWKGWNSGFIPQGYFFGYFKTFFHAGKEGVTVNQYVFSGFWNSFNGRSSSWWKVFQKLRVFETTVSNKECKMQMYTTGIFISSNGTSPFLMGETSSNGCFSIAMLVFGV